MSGLLQTKHDCFQACAGGDRLRQVVLQRTHGAEAADVDDAELYLNVLAARRCCGVVVRQVVDRLLQQHLNLALHARAVRGDANLRELRAVLQQPLDRDTLGC